MSRTEKTLAVIAIFAFGVLIGHWTAPVQTADYDRVAHANAELRQRVIDLEVELEDQRADFEAQVLPTCEDLGYDGAASCVDEYGVVVRPGG